MSEITPGYNPEIPDPDDPSHRIGWSLFDYIDRLNSGQIEWEELKEAEQALVRSAFREEGSDGTEGEAVSHGA